jgi:chemotaxis protein MotA
MDRLTLSGLFVAFGAILFGQYLEGGAASSLLNGPAVLIVLGGTVGAVMIQSPTHIFARAMKITGWVLKPPVQPVNEVIEKIVAWSQLARKEGLLGLESVVEQETDPFVQKGLQLLVDGSEPETIRGILEVELLAREQVDMQAAKVYESMGGYSPTIGIIGAVMGLIHVMGHLGEPDRLGGGIAVAFVATIYGVGLANLIFLPAANKLKSLVGQQLQFREMLIEGIVAIADGENPRNIEGRLLGYLT